MEDLAKTKGIGRDKAIALKSAFTLALRLAQELGAEAPLIETAAHAADYLREDFRTATVEHFKVILLNRRARLLRVESISQGTLDTILVHPREVFRHAIAANAASLVLVHNHPSGDPTPSAADVTVTRDLIRAGQILKIDVVDHVIIGQSSADRPKDYFSMREAGLCAF